MKIKWYVLDDSNDHSLTNAVSEAMALFQITASVCSYCSEDVKKQLPQDSVLVRNTIMGINDDNRKVEVVTEILFWRDIHTLDCMQEQRAAYLADEKPEKLAKRLIGLNVLSIMGKITGSKPSPWGILRGVRPTKIVHRLLDQGMAPRAAAEKMALDYAVDQTKAELATEVAVRQRSFLSLFRNNTSSRTVSIYIGIPYCPSRCLYCSFPAYVLPDRDTINAFMTALKQDIAAMAELIDRHNLIVQNIYVGGGTPTSLPGADFSLLLGVIRQSLINTATREFTIEAGRPDSIDDEKIAAMQYQRVTRVSLNPQTMQQKTLKHIGRMHTVQDIIDMFQKLRNVEIPVINMDIIVGLPGECEADITNTMEQISLLEPDNLTIHTLALKKGSLLKNDVLGPQQYILPDEASVVEMLQIANSYARRMSMQPYYLYRQKYMAGNQENVGYARPGTECLYNIQMMEERQTIIGIGPAAATKAVDINTWRLQSCYNAKDVHTYIKNLAVYLRERQTLLTRLFACKGE